MYLYKKFKEDVIPKFARMKFAKRISLENLIRVIDNQVWKVNSMKSI